MGKYGGKHNKGAYATIQVKHKDVTGSRSYAVISIPEKEEKFRLLVDCGLYQGKPTEEEENGKLDFDPSLLDAVILTHAHVDHSGQIPLLFAKYANCPVYMTNDTHSIVRNLLSNTCAIQESYGCSIYNSNDLENAMQHFETLPYGKWIELKNKMNMPSGVFVRFSRNEHMPGAACISVMVNPGKDDQFCMVFAGDYNKTNELSKHETVIPKAIKDKPVSFMLMESTYGNRSKKDVVYGKFEADVKKYVGEGKSMVITAFAVMRFQTVLYRLKKMQDAGELSTDIPIYIDGGMGIAYTYMWPNLETVDVKDYMPKHMIDIVPDRELLIYGKKQFILITTSGMGNFGPAIEYLPMAAANGNIVIYFTGYLAEGTTGRALLNAEAGKAVNVNGKTLLKFATVDFTEDMSAHARKEDLQEFVAGFKEIKFLAWNHGSTESRATMNMISSKMPNVVESVAVDGETAYQVNKDGLIKMYPIASIPEVKPATRRQERAVKKQARPKGKRSYNRRSGKDVAAKI